MKRTLLSLLALGITAAACGSGDSDTGASVGSVSVDNAATSRAVLEPASDAVVVLPDGWFEMHGYGTVLHVDNNEVTPHYVTTTTCVVGDAFDNEFAVDHASDDGTITLDLVGPATDYRLLDLSGEPTCDTEANRSLDALDELFTNHYPFFEQRTFDWPIAVSSIRSATENEPTAFEPALMAALIELGDGHTTLDELDIDPDIEAFGLPDVTTIDELERAIGQEFDRTIARIEDAATDESGSFAWGRVDNNTGYLIMVAFEGIGDEDDAVADRDALIAALDAAVVDLGHFDHLVIDMRFNGGGYEDLAVLAAGYFVNEVTPAYRKWAHAQPDPFVQTIDVEPSAAFFAGDVAVVTSPITASAAEVFTLAMVEVADATVVGNPSFGEFSDAIDWTLPNGIELTLSMENYVDLAGNNHEAAGVPVDVPSTFDQSIDAAITHLNSDTPIN